jgi:hypothetical protein
LIADGDYFLQIATDYDREKSAIGDGFIGRNRTLAVFTS